MARSARNRFQSSLTSLILRVVALTSVLFLCFAVAGGVVGQQSNAQTSEAAGTAALLLLVCFLEAAVLSYLILRSRWSGWALVAAVFFVFYGVSTVMPQSESAVFLTRLPPGTVPRLFLMGLLIAAPFSVLAVLILGKRKGAPVDSERTSRLVMPPSEWTWKLALIAVIYVILYFTFGYFVAWQNPAVPEYYGMVDEGNFFVHLGTVLHDTPWLVPFQVLRAMGWVVFALPVIRMFKGQQLETMFAIGLLFAVVNVPLLLPNPFMPEPVRMAHLVETTTSNFIFGMLIGWLLRSKGSESIERSGDTTTGSAAVFKRV